MRRFIYFIAIVGTLYGCGQGSNGELVGVQGRQPWFQDTPYGMLYIKAGSYNMGQSDQDVLFLHQTRSKTVSIQAFYMDQTEISNNEYRQFVYWVRDSIMRRMLIDNDDPEIWGTPTYEMDGAVKGEDEWSINWGERFLYGAAPAGADDPNQSKYGKRDLLADMFLAPHERYYNRMEINTRKLMFNYYWIDLKEAARKGKIDIVRNGYDNQQVKIDPKHRTIQDDARHPFTDDPLGRDMDLGQPNKKGGNNAIRSHEDRSRFIIHELINVYPDTLCWVHDFTYSFNEPMTNMYFWHTAYDDYPVVGVTWSQARAFCVWRTQLLNSWRASNYESFVQDFRLPTEAEWEYGARGDLDLSPYPWGGPYIRNAHGCFLGNFKPMRGRYMEDGGFHTVKVNSYHPNDYGLYCMAGNVAEWTRTAYDESVYEFSHDLNPEYTYDAMDWDPPSMKRKVIRGGSWKDIGYYLQTGTRTYEYQDSAKSYIGYRCVMSYLGRGGADPTGDAAAK